MSLNQKLHLMNGKKRLPWILKFDEELKKQQLNLQRKEDELEKIYQVISKKAELLKLENEEKATSSQSQSSTKKIGR